MPKSVKVEKTLVVGCIHTPFEDKRALDATLDFANYWKPDRLVLNGDAYDLYALMRHRKDPDKERMLNQEIEAARDLNSKIRKAVGKNCEIIFNEGNHEFRWRAYLVDNAKTLSNVDDMAFEKVFRLEDSNIKFNRGPGGYASIHVGLVEIGHFETLRKNSAASAQAIVLNSFGSVIAHHSHRMGTFGKTTPNGRFIGQEGGCLCDTSVEYVKNPDWEQGFVIMQQLKEKPRYHINPVRVVGGNILFNDKLF